MNRIRKGVVMFLTAVLCMPAADLGRSVQVSAENNTGQSLAHEKGTIVNTADTAENVGTEENAGTERNVRSDSGVWLMVDSQNRYEGMEKTYAEGYVPKVENNMAYVVLPLIADGEMQDSALRVSADLGDSENTPFVSKNYIKDIVQSEEKINDSEETSVCWLLSFELELREDRSNGSYPVVFTVKGKDIDGNSVKKKFTIYVTIRDGKTDGNSEGGNGDGSGEGDHADGSSQGDHAGGNAADGTDGLQARSDSPENSTGSTASGGDGQSSDIGGNGISEEPDFTPKVVVQSCSFSKSPIHNGDEVQADIILLNTSKSDTVRNMTVTISAPNEYFSLKSPSDTIYVDSIPAGQTYTASYIYQVNASAPQGQYAWTLALDYADPKGASVTAEGSVQVSVEQPVKVEFDPLVISSEVQIADVVEAQIQAMNLGRGKVYNVRAVIEADGLNPQGTIFIGDMEAGTTASGSTQVSVSGLSEGDSSYGASKGTVTFYYEDEGGTEYTETKEFSTMIQSPFSETSGDTKDDPGQWWIIMAAVCAVLCAFAVVAAVKWVKKKKAEQ